MSNDPTKEDMLDDDANDLAPTESDFFDDDDDNDQDESFFTGTMAPRGLLGCLLTMCGVALLCYGFTAPDIWLDSVEHLLITLGGILLVFVGSSLIVVAARSDK